MSNSSERNELEKIGLPVEETPNGDIPEGLCLEVPNNTIEIHTATLIHDPFVYENLIKYSYFLRLASILDLIFCILIFSNSPGVLSLIISLPIVGYLAAKYYHKGLITFYGFYLVIKIILKAILFTSLSEGWKTFMFSGCKVTFDFIVLLVLISFYKNLSEIGKEEKNALRMNDFTDFYEDIARVN
ncbi:hypothetical protein SteCoe_21399 [Stentor coeruleus]|uniref:Uncharacterized protein n=1 Tax=Stentor coeruleus TaxID=5963 RepID=A0A1R2BPJ5_9CILI|nr:hypothetical protein SteCoe_21399 [Stentor coeruleus]